MSTERINFSKVYNDYRYTHGMQAWPENEPTEYPVPLPQFTLGAVVKLSTHYESDSGRLVKRRKGDLVGERIVTEAEREEYARELEGPLVRMTRAEKVAAVRMMHPCTYVQVELGDRLEVITPECTMYNTPNPTWSACQVRNPRTGEQFVVHRGELQLA